MTAPWAFSQTGIACLAGRVLRARSSASAPPPEHGSGALCGRAVPRLQKLGWLPQTLGDRRYLRTNVTIRHRAKPAIVPDGSAPKSGSHPHDGAYGSGHTAPLIPAARQSASKPRTAGEILLHSPEVTPAKSLARRRDK